MDRGEFWLKFMQRKILRSCYCCFLTCEFYNEEMWGVVK